MKIEYGTNLKETAKDLLLIPLVKGKREQADKLRELERVLDLKLSNELKHREFEWKAGQSIAIDTLQNKKVRRIILFCWDDSINDEFKLGNQYRSLGAQAYQKAHNIKCKTVCVDCAPLQLSEPQFGAAFLQGFELSSYKFSKYKKEPARFEVGLVLVSRRKTLTTETIKTARVTNQAIKLARDLVNTPARDCTPRFLVGTARQIATKGRLKCEIYNEQALRKIGAGGILAVSKGSSEPAFLIKLTYRPSKKTKKTIALVGKGVTFDSGGLSIKPADGMMTMKMDMSGAAAVLATMQAIAILKPEVAVKAYIPTTENMINGQAQRPGDVIKAINGKTIEVLNTDAEGRLILADALCMAEKDAPDVIIDLATLTGAVVIALGTDYAGLYANNQKLSEALIQAGNLAGERLWPLPLAEEYEPHIRSSIADIRNIGSGRSAGSITAALFLKHFVNKTDWAHLDIAGTAYTETAGDYISKGGVGFGVRTLLNYIARI